MAGAGVRVFQPGEVLTAALVNTYLQDQVVCRFDNAADRDNSFGGAGQPTLEEGRVCYLDSINALQYYSGSAWVAINSEAVIGLIQTKGDLVVGTGLNTLVRLPVGANGLALIADSTTASGVTWGTLGIADGSITPAKLADATINIKTANYSLILTDKNKFIKMNSSSNRTITVPLQTTANFPEGSQIHIIRYGSGTLEIVGESGAVIIYATPGKFLRAQYSSATLLKCADTNVWMLMGDLSAS